MAWLELAVPSGKAGTSSLPPSRPWLSLCNILLILNRWASVGPEMYGVIPSELVSRQNRCLDIPCIQKRYRSRTQTTISVHLWSTTFYGDLFNFCDSLLAERCIHKPLPAMTLKLRLASEKRHHTMDVIWKCTNKNCALNNCPQLVHTSSVPLGRHACQNLDGFSQVHWMPEWCRHIHGNHLCAQNLASQRHQTHPICVLPCYRLLQHELLSLVKWGSDGIHGSISIITRFATSIFTSWSCFVSQGLCLKYCD